MYAFLRVDTARVPGFDDRAFALELLENKHVLIAPGSSFNVLPGPLPYRHLARCPAPDGKPAHGRRLESLAG
jgi:aspartate/methionine/tyrosine aminotransferase